MGNFFKNLLDSMKFSDDDEEYEAYLSEQNEKEEKQKDTYESSLVQKNYEEKAKRFSSKQQENIMQLDEKRNRSQEKSRLVSVRNSNYKEELGLFVSKPKSYDECQDISDILVNGTAVVINLEGFDDEMAQRIMDFVSGTVYAIKGTLITISIRIYLALPENVNISGDVETILSQSMGGTAPTISKDF